MARLPPSQFRAKVASWPKAAGLAFPVALGVLAATGHEGIVAGFWPVTIAMTVALLVMPLDTSKRTAGFGWLMGLGYFAFTLRWIIEPFLVDIARHGWMAPFAILLMAGGLALFWALAFGAARWLAVRPEAAMLWLAVTLTAAELLRGHVFTGFPWGLQAYVLVGGMGDVWLAWIGAHGTGLLLTGVAAVTAYCLHRRWTLIWPALALVFLVTMSVQGLTPPAPAAQEDQTVRLIQPNAPQHQKWDPEWMPVFFDRAIAQTRAGDAPDVVIWPETSIPALLDYAEPWLAEMARAGRGASMVAGIQRREAGSFYNSLISFDAPDEVTAIYDKAHLVPFGEYIPLAWMFEPIGLSVMVEQVSGFTAGEGTGLIEIDGLGLARVLICYEGIFPEDMQLGEIRPEILLIITNDAWFGTGPGPRQHLVQAQARAIEQGLPVVRAANTGISAVIDARGRIVDSLLLNEAGFLDAPVPAPLPPTLYARIGDWPLALLLAISIIGAALWRRRFAIDGMRTRG